MSFEQKIHVEQDAEERVEMYWDFKPSDGLVQGQRFAVMSIVSPTETNQKADCFGIKIFGCFATLEEATTYAKRLQEECNAFDYYTVETQCWAKLPPKVDKLDDQHYQEAELETLKKRVISMRKARAQLMEERMLADKKAAKEAAAKAALEAAPETAAEAALTEA